MYNRIVLILALIIFLFVLISCQENINEPRVKNNDNKTLQRDRLPTIDVEGKVSKASNPVSGATIKLYKGQLFLDQTTSNDTGYYNMNVCGHEQHSGTYTVRATKYIHEEEWCDSQYFYWDEEEQTESFWINLYLVSCEQK